MQVPEKSELTSHYESMSIYKMSQHYNTTPYVIKKWFDHHDIQIISSRKRYYGFDDKPKSFWEDIVGDFKSQSAAAIYLNCSEWTVRFYLTKFDLKLNGKVGHNAHNRIEMPSKDELMTLYETMSLLEMSKHYGNVSNVTIKKWFVRYDIPIRSHRDNQKKISVPKATQSNLRKKEPHTG